MEILVPNLYSYFNNPNSDLMPKDVVGAKIINIGCPKLNREEGGCLIVIYKNMSGDVKSLELRFNELSMWIESISLEV